MKYCTHCGKEIADAAVICLNCGCAVQQRYSTAQPYSAPQPIYVENETEPQLAIWSKICGIVSFFIGWFALGITAIVLASMSKDETGGTMCPSAKIGFICGIVSTALSALLFLLIITTLVAVGL